MKYKLELANIKELDIILNLYKERINWFKDNNINQWGKYFTNHPKSEFIEAIESKRFYVIKNQNEIVGGFELSNDSKEWNDDIIPAYYIYKVITKVGYKNIGNIIFDTCKMIAMKNDKKYLRLYCSKKNEKLNKIYENYDFKLVRYFSNEKHDYALREFKIK